MSIVDAVQMKASTTASPAARDSTLGLGEAIFCRKKHDSNSKFEGSFATRWLVVQPKDYARGAGSRSFYGRPSNFLSNCLALHNFELYYDRKKSNCK